MQRQSSFFAQVLCHHLRTARSGEVQKNKKPCHDIDEQINLYSFFVLSYYIYWYIFVFYSKLSLLICH